MMKTRIDLKLLPACRSISPLKCIIAGCCLFFLSSLTVFAQCPAGNVLLTTQADVDGFSGVYPGCTHLAVSLTIGPSADINNLNGLAALEQIGGSLTISGNTALTDMTGLSNLTVIGIDVIIANNPVLESIDLSATGGSVNGNVYIQNNAILSSFAAPEALVSIAGDLFILNNPNLAVLTGLENLTSIGNRFRIGNTLVADLPDFSNLTSVHTDIVIQSNPNITTLNLQNVAGSLSDVFNVTNNSSLATLAAPINLSAVGGDFLITGNPNLSDLSGLENLVSVGGRFRINDTLENDFPDFSNLTAVGQEIVIQNNLNVTGLNFQNVGGTLSTGPFLISGNPALESLAGPVNLHTVGTDIFISNNASLTTITGLENVTTIGQYLWFDNIPASVFPDFSNVVSVGRRIYFAFNPNVTSINLQNVGGGIGFGSPDGIFIIQNPSLTSLAAPEPLTSVTGTIQVGFNPGLSNFTGFGNLSDVSGTLWFSDIIAATFPDMLNLSAIGGDLVIAANTGIENLDWIANLQSIGQSLRINHNPLLSNCAINAVCSFLAGAGNRFITANTGCCLDEPVLTDACNNIGSGTGEICDGEDNDCDGQIDEGFDQDEDGYTTCQGDCDDTNAAVHPGAEEVCDQTDNNCDGTTDEGFDLDGDSVTVCAGDCDDNNPDNYPGNGEVCDGQDNNCDGTADEGFDQDGDGVTACNGDCDDNDPDNYPGNGEVCDGQDNNCDGTADEGLDLDADGIADCQDNCPDTANPDQADGDCDGAGDACDQWPGCDDNTDSDHDGVPDCIDPDELANWACGNRGVKVYVCHYPPGNPGNRHTICISPNAVATHLDHHYGDYIGECDQVFCPGGYRASSAGNSLIDHSDNWTTNDFQLFPNPTSGAITLDLRHFAEQYISISIYNHFGQPVYTLPKQELHNPTIEIDLRDRQLPNGVYLLFVQSAEGRQVRQFVVTW